LDATVWLERKEWSIQNYQGHLSMDESSSKGNSFLPARFGRVFQPELLLVLAALIIFHIFNTTFQKLQEASIWYVCFAPLIALTMCVLAPGPRAADVIKPLRIITCVVAVLLAVYLALAPITYPAGISATSDWALLTVKVSVAGAIFGAISTFWRPAFVILPAAVLMQQKAVAAILFDTSISQTDYIPIQEMALFTGAGLMLMGGGIMARLGPVSRMIKRCDLEWAMVLIFMAAVGAHFSNYFYSGLQKVSLDGGPWLWVLENPTHILTANAWLGGFFPLGAWRDVSAQTLQYLEIFVPLLNIVTLLGQLCAVIFVVRRVTMIGITLFYDLTHITIFLISGIFFWKWIILNAALVAAMKYLKPDAERPTAVILAAIMVLGAPEIFHIARLGWYDTPALTRTEIVAVTKDGQAHIVPANYFGTISVSAAQHRLGRPAEGHFPTVTWGTTQSGRVLQEAREGCSFGMDEEWRYPQDASKIVRLIERTHAYALQKAGEGGLYRYDFYPHHIWSNPFMFQDFAHVAPSQIDTYLYRTISSCITLSGGVPEETRTLVDEIEITVTTKAK